MSKPTTSDFTKTNDWLNWYSNPSKPRFQLPANSVDAHCHVFGPGAKFPYAPERKYTPCDAGVRGVRFNFVKRLVDFTPKDELLEIATHIKRLGWHVVIYFEAVDLPELWDFFSALPTIVVDHMGRPDVANPVDGAEFELFVRFMHEHTNVWSKVTCPERLSVSGPKALSGEKDLNLGAYQDVIPFAKRIVEEFPDRMLWGTNWPHPNLKGHMPDDGLLVDFIPHIATTPELQQKLLVDNPMRLYWS